ncbi:MAG: hypothetical protein ACK5SU_07515, partial [Phenylobacterium sp.]
MRPGRPAAAVLATLALSLPAAAQEHAGHGAGAGGDMARAVEALYLENGGQRLGGVRLDLAVGGAGAPGGEGRVAGAAWTGVEISGAGLGVRAETDATELELA